MSPFYQHVVTLPCKDEECAKNCLSALKANVDLVKKDYNALEYTAGLKAGSQTEVYLIEKWSNWEDLDRWLTEQVVPK